MKNQSTIETETRGGSCAPAPCSADWLWGDIVGADISERTVTVQLRDGELPTVEVGDATRIFLRRWSRDATHGKGPCAGTSRPKPDVTTPRDEGCGESAALISLRRTAANMRCVAETWPEYRKPDADILMAFATEVERALAYLPPNEKADLPTPGE